MLTHKWVLLLVFIASLAITAVLRQNPFPTPDHLTQEAQSITIKAQINAQNLTRGLIQAHIQIPCSSGVQYIWFPKWIPGIHAPRGAIQNMAGLEIYDQEQVKIKWQRDPNELCRFKCIVPGGSTVLNIHFDYICNQPSTNSIGVDSYGDTNHGVISWNNIIVYPEAYSNEHIFVDAHIDLPRGWELFTALKQQKQDQGIAFEQVNLRTCIDSPMICGKFHKSYQLNTEGKDVHLHTVGEDLNSIQCDEHIISGMRHLVTESRLLFGHEHFNAYHFLLVCSNAFPHLGLEHLESSLNGVNKHDLPNNNAGGATRVMAHEYVHSWCGKFRRPLGMMTSNYHDSKDTTLLWIYEGLTQYLGNVLAVRSGLRSQDDFSNLLRYYISNLRSINGRRWRSLADTATASYLLRGGSKNWPKWLRGQDYYIEGAMIWLEVDALIRSQSEGKRSLDDFCKAFLGSGAQHEGINPFTYDDVLRILNDIHPYTWHEFFDKRVYQSQEEFDVNFLAHSGWQVSFEEEPDASGDNLMYFYRNAYESIGVGLNSSGVIYRVLKNSPGYKAGLARHQRVISINGRRFSPSVLHQALLKAKDGTSITFKIDNGNDDFNVHINYQDGPRYLVLKRNNDKNILADILQQQRSDP